MLRCSWRCFACPIVSFRLEDFKPAKALSLTATNLAETMSAHVPLSHTLVRQRDSSYFVVNPMGMVVGCYEAVPSLPPPNAVATSNQLGATIEEYLNFVSARPAPEHKCLVFVCMRSEISLCMFNGTGDIVAPLDVVTKLADNGRSAGGDRVNDNTVLNNTRVFYSLPLRSYDAVWNWICDKQNTEPCIRDCHTLWRIEESPNAFSKMAERCGEDFGDEALAEFNDRRWQRLSIHFLRKNRVVLPSHTVDHIALARTMVAGTLLIE